MKYILIASFISIFPTSAFAKLVKYELSITREEVNLSGKKAIDFSLMVNHTIPAPTLEFTEGDDAEIVVKNESDEDEVSIHWHGILLDSYMDGVPYVNTPPIFPGKSHTFRFKIRQHGTYWYHSHTNVQEQKGVYGAIIIHPKKPEIKYDRDIVAILSDWSDEDPTQVLKNLRKDGEYYLYKKKTMRSLWGAYQTKSLSNYFYNEMTRMGGMDYSDVGYDAFLINGKRSSNYSQVIPGEKVRIRIINAAASSYFYIQEELVPKHGGNGTIQFSAISRPFLQLVNTKTGEVLISQYFIGTSLSQIYISNSNTNYDGRTDAINSARNIAIEKFMSLFTPQKSWLEIDLHPFEDSKKFHETKNLISYSRFTEAKEVVSKYLAITSLKDSDKGKALFSLAVIESLLGNFTQAESIIIESNQLYPNEKTVEYLDQIKKMKFTSKKYTSTQGI